jgi:hypothetical protein
MNGRAMLKNYAAYWRGVAQSLSLSTQSPDLNCLANRSYHLLVAVRGRFPLMRAVTQG